MSLKLVFFRVGIGYANSRKTNFWFLTYSFHYNTCVIILYFKKKYGDKYDAFRHHISLVLMHLYTD